jgi:hypothetical protein
VKLSKRIASVALLALLLAGCHAPIIAPVKPVIVEDGYDNTYKCTKYLTYPEFDSSLHPECVGVAEAYAYNYIHEHPELLIDQRSHHE